LRHIHPPRAEALTGADLAGAPPSPVLRLIRWNERAGGDLGAAAGAAPALLLTGRAVLALEAPLADPALGGSAWRCLRLASARARLGGCEAALLEAAAVAVRTNAAFLAPASRPVTAGRRATSRSR
jgi:hypothetical protein